MVESIIYKYINGNLAQEYAANWKVESQNLPSGSTIKTSEVPSQFSYGDIIASNRIDMYQY